MQNLQRETSWSDSLNQTTKQKTYTFPTAGKYVDKNIQMTINVPSITLANGEDFVITDPVCTWHWEVDANGNVTVY